jgi:hypothetical protein
MIEAAKVGGGDSPIVPQITSPWDLYTLLTDLGMCPIAIAGGAEGRARATAGAWGAGGSRGRIAEDTPVVCRVLRTCRGRYFAASLFMR